MNLTKMQSRYLYTRSLLLHYVIKDYYEIETRFYDDEGKYTGKYSLTLGGIIDATKLPVNIIRNILGHYNGKMNHVSEPYFESKAECASAIEELIQVASEYRDMMYWELQKMFDSGRAYESRNSSNSGQDVPCRGAPK